METFLKVSYQSHTKHELWLTSFRVQKVWMANGIYNLSTALIKLALLLQYLRILDPRSNLYKLTAGLIVVVSLWGIVFTVLAFVPW